MVDITRNCIFTMGYNIIPTLKPDVSDWINKLDVKYIMTCVQSSSGPTVMIEFCDDSDDNIKALFCISWCPD